MTGYRSRHFRHSCDNDGCYVEHLPNWDFLEGTFPRKIHPTDIDAMVEIRGNVLFLEEKGAGVPVPEGQRRALLSLSGRPGISTILFRPPARPATDLECLIFGQGKPSGWQPRSREWLREWLGAWSADADANPYIGEAVHEGGEAA